MIFSENRSPRFGIMLDVAPPPNRLCKADFYFPEDANKRLRVAFPRVEITRTLDELPLSTEEPEKWTGLKAEHFAYERTLKSSALRNADRRRT